MKLADVADQLTIWHGAGHSEDFLEERLLVYNALYHDHLPPLRDSGLVSYNQELDTVAPGPVLPLITGAVGRRLLQDYTELVQAEKRACNGETDPD